VAEVKFNRRFDFPCKVYFTPEGSPIVAKEVFLKGDQMTVVSSIWPGRSLTSEPVRVTWLIYGLIDIEALPTWYIHFYSAITQVSNGLYKTGLFDYAVSFETLLKAFSATACASATAMSFPSTCSGARGGSKTVARSFSSSRLVAD
jgi:hypothetical protein